MSNPETNTSKKIIIIEDNELNREKLKGLLNDNEYAVLDASVLNSIEIDSLTGLYNQQAFFARSKVLLELDSRREYDIFMVDIQNFKLVNSIFGEDKGDEVLKYISNYLKEHGTYELLARYSGDRFVGIVEHIEYIADERVQDWFMKLLQRAVEDAPVPNLVLKCGFYNCVDRHLSIQAMCDRALLAVKSVKHNYEKAYAIYDGPVSKQHLRAQTLESSFEQAVKNKEFVVWYQPKFDAISERLVGFEALVRWKHADGSMVSPADFIPVFEKDGLIIRLDEYVFNEVCRMQRGRLDAGEQMYPVSINLSRVSLYHEGTVERYIDIADKHGISKEYIPIEVTESAEIDNYNLKNITRSFKNAGFVLSMDDFGAGVSSLASFISLPFDEVKLDKSLVEFIGDAGGDELLKHTIEMAHFKGMKVVAEGVECWEQVTFLKVLGCDIIQGFYFSAPKPYGEILKLIDKDHEISAEKTAKIEAVNAEAEMLRRERLLMERLAIVQSMSKIFTSAFYIDLEEDSFIELTGNDESHRIDNSGRPQDQLNVLCDHMIVPKHRNAMKEFTDLFTLNERLKNKDVLSMDFQSIVSGWNQCYFIKGEVNSAGRLTKVFFATRLIHDEKERELAKEKEHINEIKKNLDIIKSLGAMYHGIYEIDLRSNSFVEISAYDFLREAIGTEGNARDKLKFAAENLVIDEYKTAMAAYCNFDTIAERLMDKQSDAYIFEGQFGGWTQSILNVSERDEQGVPVKVLMVFRDATEEMVRDKNNSGKNSILEALTREFGDIFLFDLNKNKSYTYKTRGELLKNAYISARSYDQTWEEYIGKYVHPDDAQRVREELKAENLREHMKHESEYTISYRVLIKDMEYYFTTVLVGTTGFKKDSRFVVAGFKLESARKISEE